MEISVLDFWIIIIFSGLFGSLITLAIVKFTAHKFKRVPTFKLDDAVWTIDCEGNKSLVLIKKYRLVWDWASKSEHVIYTVLYPAGHMRELEEKFLWRTLDCKK